MFQREMECRDLQEYFCKFTFMLVQKYNVKSSAKLDKLKRQLCKLFCYHTYILQGISYGLEKFERAIVLVTISTII